MSENIGNDAQAELRRFPCKQMVYTKYVGKLLPNILEEVFNELGFRVKVNHQQANGVDLEVFLENNLILVAEVLNWSIGSRLTNKRKNNYISSILTKTSSGTRILIIRLMTRSSASMSMRRLWIRISHLSQVAVPSPQGVLRTGTRSRLVGRGIGPVILTPVLSAMVFSSLHTSSSFW